MADDANVPRGSRALRWKGLVLTGFSAEVGIALTISVVGGLAYWYQARPRPWNTSAIKAEFDRVDVSHENKIEFYYTLENLTDFDYRLENSRGIHLTGRLTEQGSLSDFREYEKIEYPVFVPAKQRVSFRIEIPYSYPVKEKDNAGPGERETWRKGLKAYLNQEFGNLDGFVLFDENYRYQIIFPKGW